MAKKPLRDKIASSLANNGLGIVRTGAHDDNSASWVTWKAGHDFVEITFDKKGEDITGISFNREKLEVTDVNQLFSIDARKPIKAD